jgi:hypothetical protein
LFLTAHHGALDRQPKRPLSKDGVPRMATVNAQLQKNFKLVIEKGLPLANVDTIGTVHWLRCCPLCGSVHQIIGDVATNAPYTPLCQTVSMLFKAELVAWQKLYPDVTNHKFVHLVESTG